MSGMRSAAKGLVETRSERFESRHAEAESRQRLQQALADVPVRKTWLETRWESREGKAVLVAEFRPSPRTQRFLNALSIGMVALGLLLGRDRDRPRRDDLALPLVEPSVGAVADRVGERDRVAVSIGR